MTAGGGDKEEDRLQAIVLAGTQRVERVTECMCVCLGAWERTSAFGFEAVDPAWPPVG